MVFQTNHIRGKWNIYDHYNSNCVDNKMLKYDRLLTAFICGLVGYFRSKLRNFSCPITSIHNRTGQIRQLSSQQKLSTVCH